MAYGKSRSRRALEMGMLSPKLGPSGQEQPAVIGQSGETALRAPDPRHTVNIAGFFGLDSQTNNPGTAPSGGSASQGQATARRPGPLDTNNPSNTQVQAQGQTPQALGQPSTGITDTAAQIAEAVRRAAKLLNKAYTGGRGGS